MNIKLTDCKWQTSQKVILEVSYTDEDDPTKELHVYGINPLCIDTEIASTLLEMVISQYSDIKTIPVKKSPYTPEEEENSIKKEVMDEVDANLIKLSSPRYIAMGQIDPEFEKKRLRLIQEWLDVEKQPDFPYEIDWPEVI